MHPQAVKVAPLARDVAAKRSCVLFRRIKSATADAYVVAGGHRQGVHRVGSLGVASLEHPGQRREESPPEFGLDGVDAAVEATLADRGGHVAVLAQEPAGPLHVPAEEGGGHQGDGHHLGGGQAGLWVVSVPPALQELVAQAVDGGYGIVHCCPPGSEKVLGSLPTGRILSASVGGNLGYLRFYYSMDDLGDRTESSSPRAPSEEAPGPFRSW